MPCATFQDRCLRRTRPLGNESECRRPHEPHCPMDRMLILAKAWLQPGMRCCRKSRPPTNSHPEIVEPANNHGMALISAEPHNKRRTLGGFG